jgi:hypothetical protein
MKKLPKEQHKQRVLLFIDPNIIDNLGKQKCQEVAKESIAKEHKKFLRFNKLK